MNSHDLNVSTERLEMMFWTSRLGNVSDWRHWRHSNVSVSSRSRHLTCRLQPWMQPWQIVLVNNTEWRIRQMWFWH